MIIKASQRGSGQNLAVHLMRVDDNEHVDLHELRGFVSDNLKDAFKEAEAVSLGTRCRQYLFSVSFSPPADKAVSAADFERVIDRAEKLLGLEDQPRAIVFHEKEGRRHAHCVWSRIDADTMTARHMPFFKNRLMGLSRELYLEFGWQMPHGLIASEGRNPTNFTLAEWQQAKRLQSDPRWLKQVVQDCWTRSDGRAAFERGLSEHALFLCKGDRRGFVIVDHAGEVYALARQLGLKSKNVAARLGDPEGLRSVEDAKKAAAKLLAPAMQRHIAESKAAFEKRKTPLDLKRENLTRDHRAERADMAARHQREFDSETRERAARLPKGVRGLWFWITGRSGRLRRQNDLEAEASKLRQADEKHALIERQLEQRRALQQEVSELRNGQADQLRQLRREVGRFLGFARAHVHSVDSKRAMGASLKLER